MELVEANGNDIFCDSSMVARKFGQDHDKVRKIINGLCDDLSNLDSSIPISNRYKIVSEQRTYRGRNYNVYLMDRDFFSLLAMRFKTKKALEWQIKFINAFMAMENKILQFDLNESDKDWISARQESKQIRRKETDVIKDFVEYATEQGSQSAKFYYKHITKATYKALGFLAQKKPKLRESLNIIETSELILAENKATQLLKQYMDTGMKYKDIYKYVKKDLIVYADSIRDFKHIS